MAVSMRINEAIVKASEEHSSDHMLTTIMKVSAIFRCKKHKNFE